MLAKQAFLKAKSDDVFGQRRKQSKMFRAGLYARFDQRSADAPMQIRAMREYAAKRGWVITMQVKEVGSGVSQREPREKLLVAARRRKIDVVLVWRLDRFRLAHRRLDLTVQPAQAMARIAVRILSATPSVYDQDTSRCQAWA